MPRRSIDSPSGSRVEVTTGGTIRTSIYDVENQKLYMFDNKKKEADVWDMAQFSAEISKAVPGMDSLLSAAPAASSVVGTAGGAIGGSAAGLASAASAFSKLGLSPDMVSKSVPVLTQFVGKSGGSQAADLLTSVLK